VAAAPTWGDVINAFISAVQAVLYQVATFLRDNAGVIATAAIGVGLAIALTRYLDRIPFVRGLLRLIR
jgi:multidrug efflux pump subunit AcrB